MLTMSVTNFFASGASLGTASLGSASASASASAYGASSASSASLGPASLGPASLAQEESKGNAASLLECQVCCENLNKSSNKPVVCTYSSCAYSACVSCVRTYLLENPQSAAHCMACKKPFNNLFLVQALTSSWTNNTYLPQVSAILTEMELARLPESMEEAEKIKKIDRLDIQLYPLTIARTKLLYPLNKLKRELLECSSHFIREEIAEKIRALNTEEHRKQLKEVRASIHNIKTQINAIKNINEEEKEKRVFTMPCAYNECKGMLSTQYKCGLCDKYTCKDCSEPLQDEHKCNPDNVATKKAILKDTRPCPKCSARIFKIEGCDQMWCTGCKTPFSWSTGKVVPNGQRLHNPHAIEYLRQAGITIRAPEDLVCGGAISLYQFNELCVKMDRTINTFISDDYDSLQHFIDNCRYKPPPNAPVEASFDCIIQFLKIEARIVYNIVDDVSRNKLRISRQHAQANRNFNYERIQFILNKMDRKEFAKNVKRSHKQKNSQTDMSYIWELVSTFGIEMFKSFYEASKYASNDTARSFLNLVIQKLSEFSALVKYSNSQMATVSVAHSIAVPTIRFKFDLSFPSFASQDDVAEFLRKRQLPYTSSDLYNTEKFSQVALKKMGV